MSKGIFYLLFGTIAWGLVWFPYRILDNFGISGIHSSLLSFTFAFIPALFFYRLDNFSCLKNKFFWIYAFIGGITNLSYVLAVIEGELIRVMLLFFLSPIWTILFSYLLLKEIIYTKNYVAASLSLIGAFIVLWDSDLFLSSFSQSDFFALLAGLGFALTNVLARYFKNISVKEKSYAIWIGVVVTAIIISIYFNLNFNFQLIQVNSLLILFFLGLTLLITTIVVQLGLTLIQSVRASPIFLFEIVVAGVSAYYLANETLGLQDFAGGVFIIAGVLISTRD